MKIGLIGYGKMGKLIEQIVRDRGHVIAEIVDPFGSGANVRPVVSGEADVYIDFSVPEKVVEHVLEVCAVHKNLVIGTTGWGDSLEEVRSQVNDAKIGLLYASNFSPAVQMFFRTVRAAAKLANRLPECDVAGFEAHHRHKLDTPSGTALTMAEVLLQEIERKTEILTAPPEGKIAADQLHLASMRVGEVPGTHAAIFDFPSESVEVKCTSRSRDGFALGAVLAAEWIKGKQGFHRYDDIFEEIIA